MHLIPRQTPARLRWLGWSLFWGSLVFLGQMQTWVFGDHSHKPALADIIGPLHFWFPGVLFMGPLHVLPAASSVWLLLAAELGWVLAFSLLIVYVQDRLHPRLSSWLTWAPIAGTGMGLLGLRVLAASAPTEETSQFATSASYELLCGLVVATWSYVVIGLVAIALRRGIASLGEHFGRHRS